MSIGWIDYMKAHKNDRTIHTIVSISLSKETECAHISLNDFLKELKKAVKYAKTRRIDNAVGVNLVVERNIDGEGNEELIICGEFPVNKEYCHRQYQSYLEHLKRSAKAAGFELIPMKSKKGSK